MAVKLPATSLFIIPTYCFKSTSLELWPYIKISASGLFAPYKVLLSLHAGRWDKDKLFDILSSYFNTGHLLKHLFARHFSFSHSYWKEMSTASTHSRGFIYWLLREQHWERSACTWNERRGERSERTKGHKVWGGEKMVRTPQESCCQTILETRVQKFDFKMWEDLMFLQLRTHFNYN